MNLTENRRTLLLCCALLLISAMIVSCSPKGAVNKSSDGIAIKGYDTVAYFTMGKPVKGSTEYVHEWNGAKWLFSNWAHLDMFMVNPEKYAPQYGGY